jgi:hypothetical protein
LTRWLACCITCRFRQQLCVRRLCCGQGRGNRVNLAGDKALDGDVILAAQAIVLEAPDVLIATTKVGHLSRFVPADLWQNIEPL